MSFYNINRNGVKKLCFTFYQVNTLLTQSSVNTCLHLVKCKHPGTPNYPREALGSCRHFHGVFTETYMYTCIIVLKFYPQRKPPSLCRETPCSHTRRVYIHDQIMRPPLEEKPILYVENSTLRITTTQDHHTTVENPRTIVLDL